MTRDRNDWFKAQKVELDADRAAELAQAKTDAERVGKEPFDYAVLSACDLPPSLRSVYGEAGRSASLERDYYLYYPQVMSLREFAEALGDSSQYDGGELDRDE